MAAKSRSISKSRSTTRVVSNSKSSLSWLRRKWVIAAIVLVIAAIGTVTLVLTRAADPAGVIQLSAGNFCLDNNAGRTDNGNQISVWGCHGQKAQQWTVAADGTIRTQGNWCLDVPNASTQPQTYVELWSCHGGAPQQWRINSNGSIVNPHSGLCLDNKGATLRDDNRVWMWPCNNSSAQIWITPKPAVTPTPPTAPTTPTACNPLPLTMPSIASMRASKKKVFAFYFPPFPVSIDNKAPANDSYASWVNSYNSEGGKYDLRDRPIGRNIATRSDWKQADFETEIRRAIEVGIDGFVWEYHTSSDARWNQLPAMLAAAKKVDPGFKIQLSPDFDAAAGATPDSVFTDVMKVADDTSIYRTDDGKIVLSPFYPERQPVSFWDSLQSKLAAKGVKTALVPMFLSWSGSTTEKAEWTKDHVYGYSQWGTRSTSGINTLDKDAAEAHRRGGIWMQPVAFEDTRSYDGRFWESNNSSLLRESFQSAIANNADWVVMNTWNDYTESWMSPSTERGYAVTDVASYYITWFKTGKAPSISQDAVYWFHRSQRTDAPYAQAPTGRNGQKVTMAVPNGNAASNDVEMVAFLTAPGRLTITQGSTVKVMDAGAGVTSFKTSAIAGTTPVFTIQRNSQTVKTVTSDTAVRASVPFQDMMYHAGGGATTTCARP